MRRLPISLMSFISLAGLIAPVALWACDDAAPASSAPDSAAPDIAIGEIDATPDTTTPDVAADTSSTPEVAPETIADVGPDVGPDVSPDVGADTAPDVTSDASSDSASNGDAVSGATLVGRWGQKQVQSSLTEVPFVGETVATTSTLLLLDVVASAGGFTITQTVCAIDLDSGTDLVTTVLPDAALAAIQPATRGATLASDGRVSIAGLLDVWGAALANPETDALPTSPSDASVVDHEPDGKPGMTVRVAGLIDGEVYVVQRGFTSLEGVYDGLSRIDGLVTWRQEQSILDADNPLLKSPLPTRTNPDPNASWFRTTRLGPNGDCTTVIDSADALFTR